MAGGALAAVVLWGVGFWAGRLGRSSLNRHAQESQARCARLERQAKELRKKREPAAAPAPEGSVASLARSLPHVVSQLNRADLDTKAIPDLILDLAEAIFKPTQALFYVARDVGRGKPRELHLMKTRGLSVVPDEIQVIRFGEGKIGWVAENRLDKLGREWRQLWRGKEGQVHDNHASLQIDILGPMIHHTDAGDNVLGVICLGQPGSSPSEEKLMFQMVTNLGSLALVNAENVQRLRGEANHDGLTRLHNKSHFMREVSALMLTASQQGQTVAIFIFDIDHFKTYNDTNGHPAGDALLRKLSGLLKDHCRPGDYLCRYGGEEFMLALPETDGDIAFEIADNLRRMIEDTVFEHQENQPNGNLTISGGVAAYPRDGQTLDELIRHADEALYDGKRGGRNSVRRYQCVQIGAPESETDLCSPAP